MPFPEFTGTYLAPVWLGVHIILAKFGKAIAHLPAGFIKIHHCIAPDQHVAMAEFGDLAKGLLIPHTKGLFIRGRAPFFPFAPIAAFIDLFVKETFQLVIALADPLDFAFNLGGGRA